MDGSATGDKVQRTTTTIQAFGYRVRCSTDSDLRAELRKYIDAERSNQKKWTDKEWKMKMHAIAAEDRWGVSQHGGDRTSTDWVCKMHPVGKTKSDAENAVAEPAAGGDESADEVRKMQPGGKRKRSPSGGNTGHVAALGVDKSSLATGSATLSLAAGSASGGSRLCTGVNMGYRLIGPPLGKGTFGTAYPAVWKNGNTDAGGQHVVVKHIPLARPDTSLSK